VNAKKSRKLNNQQRCNLYTYQGMYNGHFIRSSYEYIFCKYLEYRTINYKTEFKRYETDNGIYTPDFFLFSGNILKAIIEIKPSRLINKVVINKLKAVAKQENKKIFILSEKDLKNKIKKTPLRFYVLEKEWKKLASDKINHGLTNPNFGNKHSEKTKIKIRNKAIQRFKENPEYAKNLSEICKVTKIKLVCEQCGKEYYRLPSRLTSKKGKYKSKFCSKSCSILQNAKRSHSQAKKILENKIDFNLRNKFFILIQTVDINSVKLNKLPDTFWKYFESLFKEFNIIDSRTFIYRITGEHNINGRTFVTSLRGHRNGIMPFWFNTTK